LADVPAASTIAEDGCSKIRKAETVVQFAIGEQATVRRDARTVEFELDPAVETEPQRSLAAFTLRVHHSALASSPLSCWIK
jgi:hypothetical protein